MSYMEECELDYGLVKIIGDIDDKVVETIADKVFYWKQQKDKPDKLTVYIDSSGGGTSNAYAIINLLKSTNIPYICDIIGSCDSSAVTIACTGDWRIAYTDTQLLIHPPWCGGGGTKTKKTTESDLISFKMEEKRILNIMYEGVSRKREIEIGEYLYDSNKKLSDKIKKTLKEYVGNRESDTYITAKEALSLGLIDEIR